MYTLINQLYYREQMKMSRILLVATLCIVGYGSMVAQTKLVPYQKLQTFLPAIELNGFERGKPGGETITEEDFLSSEASVVYQEIAEAETDSISFESYGSTITVSIIDYGVNGIDPESFTVDETEEEDSPEATLAKATIVKGKYQGKESRLTEDYTQSCTLTFHVGKRFLITLEGNGMGNLKLLYKLAESMDLEKLERTT